ncbi:MFS transporter [Magnetovibrio blakemorei]|uniref:UNC93-like protein MFSD11 n=1 Tax=Magnetovibrio blakemorei TaxID=28181 RepID=A0A1E5Q7V5_9PROT|nr:MFS transporter [Magnetovibrio blakemorei]OEJ67348.1 hypothetical protein BEN30_09435 [Magnetovibrio blakemorei]
MNNRNLVGITAAFSLLFVYAQTLQQYITVVFAGRGDVNDGYIGLILIYVFFFLGSFVAPVILIRMGAKRSFLLIMPPYLLTRISFIYGNIALFFTACVLLGCAASLLWNAHFVYMGRISEEHLRGRNSGFFWGIFSATTGIGLVASGPLLTILPQSIVFLIYLFVGALAYVPFWKLDGKRDNTPNREGWKNQLPIFKSPTAIRMTGCIFTAYLIYGLVIAYVPLEIAEISGTHMVGILSSPFFVIPALTSFYFGKMADRLGRFPTMSLGLALSVIGLGILYYAHNTFLLFCGIAVSTFGFSALYPMTTILPADITPKGMLERMSGTFNAVGSFGILCGIIMPFLVSGKAAYLVGLGMTLAIAALTLSLGRGGLDHVCIKISDELDKSLQANRA